MGPSWTLMETTSSSTQAPSAADPAATLAEELPGLYRMILERVAELELLGDRSDAARIRMSATEAYSGSWDEGGRARLVTLINRADRVIAGHAQPRGFALRRRSVPAR
jgi:hypothetical protein